MGQDPYAYQDYSHMQAECLVAMFWGLGVSGFGVCDYLGFGVSGVFGFRVQGFGIFRV